jgi:hypothetical protein
VIVCVCVCVCERERERERQRERERERERERREREFVETAREGLPSCRAGIGSARGSRADQIPARGCSEYRKTSNNDEWHRKTPGKNFSVRVRIYGALTPFISGLRRIFAPPIPLDIRMLEGSVRSCKHPKRQKAQRPISMRGPSASMSGNGRDASNSRPSN